MAAVKIIVFLFVAVFGGMLTLFILYASNGGAGGSSSMGVGGLIVSILCLGTYLPALYFLAKWAAKPSNVHKPKSSAAANRTPPA